MIHSPELLLFQVVCDRRDTTRVDLLKSIPVFQNLDELSLVQLASKLGEERFSDRSLILRQGDISNGKFFILVYGLVNVYVSDAGWQPNAATSVSVPAFDEETEEIEVVPLLVQSILTLL